MWYAADFRRSGEHLGPNQRRLTRQRADRTVKAPDAEIRTAARLRNSYLAEDEGTAIAQPTGHQRDLTGNSVVVLIVADSLRPI